MKIHYQQPVPISDVHQQMMAAMMQATGCDERTAWVETTVSARLATPVILHGSGRVAVTDPWARYALPRQKKRAS